MTSETQPAKRTARKPADETNAQLFFRPNQAAKRLGVKSRATLYRWAHDSSHPLPLPTRIGPGASGWTAAVLDAVAEGEAPDDIQK